MKDNVTRLLKKMQPTLSIVGILLVSSILIFVLVALWGGYVRGWSWVGVTDYTSMVHPDGTAFERQKTLWNWLELLIIPVVLAVGGFLFNRSEREKQQRIADENREEQQRIADENRQETIIEEYFTLITTMMLEKGLDNEDEGNQNTIRRLAAGRTKFALERINAEYQAKVVQFLYGSALIQGSNPILSLWDVLLESVKLSKHSLSRINLSRTNLRYADLSDSQLDAANLERASLQEATLRGSILEQANLQGASLIRADIQGAVLTNADLTNTNMQNANLSRAILTDANLHGAILTSANLQSAILTNADLTNANLQNADLRGAILTNARLHNADLTGADLTEAMVDEETLAQAASLDNVTRG